MEPTETAPPAAVSFAQAARYWLRLGLVSFGGPAGQISIMHHDLVETRRWISERRFLHALNYCMVLPGPEAQQLATYIGWLLHGTAGGLVAGVLFVLPSLLLLTFLTWLYLVFGEVAVVAGILYGIKPAVTAIVVHAAWRIGSRALRNGVLWGLAAAAFVGIFALNVPFPLIVLGAAAVGLVGGRLLPRYFVLGGVHGTAAHGYGPALIDDHSAVPAHARYRWSGLLRTLVLGVGIWVLCLLGLVLAFGPASLPVRVGAFFTSAALLTFGGAYAVLPYVYQAAVTQFGWLTGTQMIDGLALGESTPGPLIMIVAFVGFIAGWNLPPFMADTPLLAAAFCATVATFFTFLPSFVFIFAGGPVVESTRGNLRLAAPLTAITAAVVGVILNLALFFAWHVLWPQGTDGPFETAAAVIGAAALLALFRFKLGVIPLIGVCAAAGLIVQLL